MSSNTNVKEIEIDIPIEKVNDLKFIQESILDGAFRALKEVATHGDIEFKELVRKFINSDEYITKTFLDKWGLTKEDISNKQVKSTEKTPESDIKKVKTPELPPPVELKEPIVSDTTETPKPKKKLVVKKKFKKKMVVKKKIKKKPKSST